MGTTNAPGAGGTERGPPICGHGLRGGYEGEYRRGEGEVRGLPWWSKGEQCLHSTHLGRWLLSTGAEHVARCVGLIVSKGRHGGTMPHRIPSWQRAGPEAGADSAH